MFEREQETLRRLDEQLLSVARTLKTLGALGITLTDSRLLQAVRSGADREATRLPPPESQSSEAARPRRSSEQGKRQLTKEQATRIRSKETWLQRSVEALRIFGKMRGVEIQEVLVQAFPDDPREDRFRGVVTPELHRQLNNPLNRDADRLIGKQDKHWYAIDAEGSASEVQP